MCKQINIRITENIKKIIRNKMTLRNKRADQKQKR